MGKITVKHYLNTNLKPYMVRGDKYYTVYMLITVNRKSTKIPSKEFLELHTEAEFEELLSTDELDREVKTVENIISALLPICNEEFDTLLFSAYYNLMDNYTISEVDKFEPLSSIRYEYSTEQEIILNNWTFYEWFSPKVQNLVNEVINLPNPIITIDNKTISKNIQSINVAVALGFFETLAVLARSLSKYRELEVRYSIYFGDPDMFLVTYLYEE